MTILVCAPHPDDEVIGMGATIAKYANQGERVVVVIFTRGEQSHPWQRTQAIQKRREREAKKAAQIIGVEETIFLELKDLQVQSEIQKHNITKQFTELIKNEQPRAIFSTAPDDIHKDHRSVANFILQLTEKIDYQHPVWTYTVWNPIHVTNREKPTLVVDVTDTFSQKWNAIQVYESQKLSTYQLIPTVLLRAALHGLRYNHRLAEVFIQAR